jgi:hypothetical protein
MTVILGRGAGTGSKCASQVPVFQFAVRAPSSSPSIYCHLLEGNYLQSYGGWIEFCFLDCRGRTVWRFREAVGDCGECIAIG